MSTATAGAGHPGAGGARLLELVQQAWSRGWEPADLHRVVARDCGKLEVELLGDLVAADLAQYSAVTVQERWHAQLETMGARVWWASHQDPLSARAAEAKGGWGAVRRATARLELLLALLQPIEQLGALPGEATSSQGTRDDVDQRLLEKVRMMLAKAEATTFPAEAETFTAAAQKLMARHSIDRALLDRHRRDRDRQVSGGRAGAGGEAPAAIRLGLDRPYESAKFTLVAAIARANRCRAIWQRAYGFSTVVGFAPDLRAVELLFTSLLVQATSAMAAEGSRQGWDGRNRTRSFRSSFLTAFAVRIGERLRSAAQAAQAEAAAAVPEAAGGPGGASAAGPGGAGAAHGSPTRDHTALVRVLAERDEEVEEAVAERFPRLRTQRSRARMDAEGWSSGTAAADRADLGTPGRLD